MSYQFQRHRNAVLVWKGRKLAKTQEPVFHCTAKFRTLERELQCSITFSLTAIRREQMLNELLSTFQILSSWGMLAVFLAFAGAGHGLFSNILAVSMWICETTSNAGLRQRLLLLTFWVSLHSLPGRHWDLRIWIYLSILFLDVLITYMSFPVCEGLVAMS